MIINSDFRDYYDSVPKSTGMVDKTVVYNRKERVLDLKWHTGQHDTFVDYDGKKLSLGFDRYRLPENTFFLGFCGKNYRAGLVQKDPSSLEHLKFWDFNLPDSSYTNRWSGKRFDLNFKSELYHIFNTPIMAVYQSQLVLNPCLKTFEFQCVIDPYTAFQEIQMFISGVLCSAKPIIEIADKDKIASHGYDKFSFRHPVK